jgi:Asp-tRNA(Asn)/Glu-tRNA(Gln) amidotransferase C subunit
MSVRITREDLPLFENLINKCETEEEKEEMVRRLNKILDILEKEPVYIIDTRRNGVKGEI